MDKQELNHIKYEIERMNKVVEELYNNYTNILLDLDELEEKYSYLVKQIERLSEKYSRLSKEIIELKKLLNQ